MDWKKVGENMKKRQLEERAELERLAVDPGPPLEATAVDGIKDWTKSIGVLYRTPTRTSDGWGVTIYPTRQQEALIDIRREKYHDESGRYDDGYLQGLDAVSIDKSGHVRMLTITEPRNFAYDMDGNIHCRCAAVPRRPRTVDRVDQPEDVPTFRTGHVDETPPKPPAPAHNAAAPAPAKPDRGGGGAGARTATTSPEHAHAPAR